MNAYNSVTQESNRNRQKTQMLAIMKVKASKLYQLWDDHLSFAHASGFLDFYFSFFSHSHENEMDW